MNVRIGLVFLEPTRNKGLLVLLKILPDSTGAYKQKQMRCKRQKVEGEMEEQKRPRRESLSSLWR